MYPEIFHIFVPAHLRRAGGAGVPGGACGCRPAGASRRARSRNGHQSRHLLRAGGDRRRQADDVPGGLAATTASIPAQIFSLATLQAGGVFYGGLIAALVVAYWYMRQTSCRARAPPTCSRPASRSATPSAGSAASPPAAAGASTATALGRHLHQSGGAAT